MKKYAWDDSCNVGKIAVQSVKTFLQSEIAQNYWGESKLIESVEDNEHFRKLDVDLLWIARVGDSLKLISIEVKGDRYTNTGNFFLETVSDVSRETPGAFIACKADWYFYYFTGLQHLYCIPLNEAQSWFREQESRFKERTTSSERDGRFWKTKGRLVPVKTLWKEVSGIRAFKKVDDFWEVREDVLQNG